MARVEIPKDVAAKVLFDSNRICCVCREPGKVLQLHHIDEDHSNSVEENLAALCLECHNKTQITGGFGRQLDASQVCKYKSDWLARIIERRNLADRLAAAAMAPALEQPQQVIASVATAHRPSIPIADFASALISIKASAYNAARADWHSGVTGRVVDGSYRVVDVFQDLLSMLASYYPPKHFDVDNPSEYIAEVLAARYRWHRHRQEPNGHGNNGSIVHTLVAGSVVDDASTMIEEMVSALTLDWSGEGTFDFKDWQRRWRAAARGQSAKRGVL